MIHTESAAALRETVKAGRAEHGMQGAGEGNSSPGSRRRIEVVDRPDRRPDFAARMDWCVAGVFEKGNHNPMAVLRGDPSRAGSHSRGGPGPWFIMPSRHLGKTVHVILEVWDDATPALVSYRRVVLTAVARPGPAAAPWVWRGSCGPARCYRSPGR